MKFNFQKENIFFMLGHFATDISHGSLPIILAYLYQAGKLDSYSSVAMLMMANTVLNAIVQPFAGNLADSGPRPYLMSIGIALSFIGVMFIGIVENQILLYTLVCINGLGSAIFHPAGGKMANIFGKSKLGKNMSIFSVGGNAGIAMGPFYFTGFYILFGLNATLAMCVPGIVMIVIFTLKNSYYMEACERDHLNTIRLSKENIEKENIRGFLILICVLFLRSSGWFSFTAFLPLYYMHNLGISDEISTLFNGVVGLCGAIATYFGGTISDRIGFKKMITISSLSSIPFIFIFTLSSNPVFATLMIVPFAFLFFTAMSPTVAIGQKFLCRHVGMATGFTIGLSMSFGGLVSPLIGKLGDFHGVEYIMYAVSVFIAMAALTSLFIPEPVSEKKIS